MRGVMRWGAAIVLAAGLGGCATDFVPDSAAASRMSVEEARATLRGATGTLCFSVVVCGAFNPDIRGIELSEDGRTLVLVETDGDRSNTVPVRSLRVSGKTLGNLGWVYFNDNGSLYLATSPDEARRVLDALIVIKEAPSRAQRRAAFAEIAKAYRAAAVKPMPGEDVRRYVVQAQAAVREERFADAAAAYEKALAIAPWWPEGHANRAFILAATGDFAQAVGEMQDYLALVPNARNARQMQDKVYEWQAKVPAAASAPVAAPELEPGSLAGRLGGALSK